MPPSEIMTVDRAAAILRAGGLVGLPTETVYGLGANALDPVAVAKIFAAKERPFFDPLIVHVPELDWLPRVVREFPPVARRLAEQFWPGPMTLVLPRNDAIPDLVTSGLPSVGVRLPDHDLMRQVLRKADLPVAAPSANPFGKLSPTTAEHVRMQLGNRIDGILEGGDCRVGIESTILQIEGDRVPLLRPGGISLEEIERLIGTVNLPLKTTSERPTAPGMLASHYAPRTPLVLVDQIPTLLPWPRAGLLVLREERAFASSVAQEASAATSAPPQSRQHSHRSAFVVVEELSPSGDLVVAAARFFQALHRLDAAGLDGIIAVRLPDMGLGRALNDRLMRAAHARFQP